MIKNKFMQMLLLSFFTLGVSNILVGQEIVKPKKATSKADLKPTLKNELVEYELQTKQFKVIEIIPKTALGSIHRSGSQVRANKKSELKKVHGTEKISGLKKKVKDNK